MIYCCTLIHSVVLLLKVKKTCDFLDYLQLSYDAFDVETGSHQDNVSMLRLRKFKVLCITSASPLEVTQSMFETHKGGCQLFTNMYCHA